MLESWRIVREALAASAFTGEGAAKYGGRWNSRGIKIVYTSGTLSLAALETLVHLIPPISIKYVVFRLEFDNSLRERIERDNLSSNWKTEPPALSTMAIGDDWVRESRTAVLEVPSVIIPGESNYLINPFHPDYKKIRIHKPERFTFDPRLLI